MLGLGGGMIYVPVLTWAGFPVREVAIPLSLLLNGLTTLMALLTFSRKKLVDWRGGAAMAVAAFIGAPLGVWTARLFQPAVLLTLFSGFALLAAIRMIAFVNHLESKIRINRSVRTQIVSGIGALAGFTGGLLGLGGGFIIAPLLIWIGYPAKSAAATTALVVTVSSFSGFLGHMAEGHGDWRLTVPVALAVLLGSRLGAQSLFYDINPATVKKLYAAVLFAIAAKLIIDVIQQTF